LKASSDAEPPKKKKRTQSESTPVTEEPERKSAVPGREDNLMYELKHLAAFDISPLDAKTDIASYTRDSVQFLVNKIFALPRVKVDVGTAVSLPTAEAFRLPRLKPIPKEKAKTRWQKFQETKGMKKEKRSSLQWDEATQDWKRRWGYKSVKSGEEARNAVVEVKAGDDPMANPFEKRSAERKLHVAKQKMREVRNKVEALGGKIRASVPDLNKSAKDMKRGKDGLREAIKRAQVSSASFGKFDRVAPNEATNLQQKKRKKSATKSVGEEKEAYMKSAGKVLSSSGAVDKRKAARLGAATEAGAPKGKGKGKGRGSGGKRRSKQGGRGRGR